MKVSALYSLSLSYLNTYWEVTYELCLFNSRVWSVNSLVAEMYP